MKELLKESQFVVGAVKAVRNVPLDIRIARWKSRRKTTITQYFAEHSIRKLQIGCGKNLLKGWLNADINASNKTVTYLDATVPFPFPSASFDYIFSEHVIEHLFYPSGQVMLRECFRILRPGGVIRISTPNLCNIITLLTNPDGSLQKQYVKRATDKYIPDNSHYLSGFVVNNFFWDFGHYFVYDPQTLSQAFTTAGFSQISQQQIGVSKNLDLSGLESHGNVVGADINAFETMVFEATKVN